MGSSLVIAVSPAKNSYLISSETAVGSLAVRKARAQDYRYVRELLVHLGGARAQLITRKFRTMLYDKERIMLTCESNGMICAFAALKSTRLTENEVPSDVLMMEYFQVCGYDRADQLLSVVESAVVEMAGGTVAIAVETGHLGIRVRDIYLERGYQLTGNSLRKKIKSA